jgi:hypothetical protein
VPPSQDFGRKIAIVLSKAVEPWMSLNAAAHIAAYLGNKMTDPFDTGALFTTRDGVGHPRNSQFPIVILSAPKELMPKLADKARGSGLLYLGFIREMIESSDDEAIARTLAQKANSDVEYLGVGVFGPIADVNAVTKGLSLWKGF